MARGALAAVPLLLLALGSWSAAAQANVALQAPAPAPSTEGDTLPAVPNWGGKGPIKACTSEYTPMVFCVDRDPDAYSGYEIELFRRVARILGWEWTMLEWSCLGWEEMMDSLLKADGKCDIAVAGIEADPELVQAGITFTRPTYQNGLSILVASQVQTNSIWSFWDAFEWQLWVITLATCAGVAITVWAIDMFYFRYSIERFSKDPLHVATAAEKEVDEFLEREHKFERYWWEVLSRAVQARDLISYTVAGNTIYLAYGFLMLILFTLYLGNTAANLTILNLTTGGITGVDSLPGQAVGTWTEYRNRLRARGIAAATYPWDTAADEEAMLGALKSGAIKALVLDTPLMQYISATDCSVSTVGEPFDIFPMATAFPVGFNNTALLDKYNEALVSLNSNGEDEQLAHTYVQPPESECSELYSSKVTLKQVAGLWILLGISIGASLVWLLIVKLWENATARRVKADKAAGLEAEDTDGSGDGKQQADGAERSIPSGLWKTCLAYEELPASNDASDGQQADAEDGGDCSDVTAGRQADGADGQGCNDGGDGKQVAGAACEGDENGGGQLANQALVRIHAPQWS